MKSYTDIEQSKKLQMEFLKSLKNRVHPKTEWGEEDEIKIKSIIAFLKSPSLCAMDGNKGIIDANIKYLKSIKDRVQPQSTWKPSDEYKEAIQLVYDEKLIPFKDGNQWCFLLGYNIQKGVCGFGDSILEAAFEFYKEYTTTRECIGELSRPQSYFSLWKPSEEQMLAIDTAINVLGKGTLNGKQLIELYQDLKRLKEE